MSDCCAPSPAGIDHTRSCPRCGYKSVNVDPMTPRALLTSAALRRGAPRQPRYCSNQRCDVVYFDADTSVLFTTADVAVTVFAKSNSDAAPVCYCFGHTRSSIRSEIEITGKSNACSEIASFVKSGFCACELRNPKGSCCLGDVRRVENEALSERNEVMSNAS